MLLTLQSDVVSPAVFTHIGRSRPKEPQVLHQLFLDHPASVGESYMDHLRASLGTAAKLGTAAAACVVHALVPGLCQTTGSTAILRLHAEVMPRRFDQPTL